MSSGCSWKNINQMELNLNGHDQKGKKSEQDSSSEFEMLELGPYILEFLDNTISKLNKITKEMIASNYK